MKGGNLDTNIIKIIVVNDPNLTTLDISGNQFGDAGAEDLVDALQSNNTLKSLDISGNHIGIDGTEALAGALKVNNKITTLNLSDNYIRDTGAKALAEALKVNETLTTLDISYNNISNGAQALAVALKVNNKMTTLNLKENRIGHEGAKALAEALGKDSKTTLKELDISYNSIGIEGAKALAEALKINKTLTTLDISHNKIRDAGAQALAEALTGALTGNTTLTTLDISDNAINFEGAIALAVALKVNNKMTTLNLKENRIGHEGAKALAEALKINKTLTTLDIRSNQFGDNGAIAFAKAIEINTTLIKLLYFTSNTIGTEGATALLNALKVNETVKNIDIEYFFDDIDKDIIKQILKKMENRNHSILFNPILESIDTTTNTANTDKFMEQIIATIEFIKANIRVKPKLLSDEQLKTLNEEDLEKLNSDYKLYKTNTIDEYIQYLISFLQPDDKNLSQTVNIKKFYSLIHNNNKYGDSAIPNIVSSEKYVINLHGSMINTIFKLPENINIVFLSPIRYLTCLAFGVVKDNIAKDINKFLTNPYCAQIPQIFRQSLIYLGGQYCPDLNLSRSIGDQVSGIHYIHNNNETNTILDAYAYNSEDIDITLSQFLNTKNDINSQVFSRTKGIDYTIIVTSCRESNHLSNLTEDVLVFYEQLVKLINYRIYYYKFLKTELNGNVNTDYEKCRRLKFENIDMEIKKSNVKQLQMYRNNKHSKGKFKSHNSNNTNDTPLIKELKQKITDYKLNPTTIDKQQLFILLSDNLKFSTNFFHEEKKNSIYSNDKDKFYIIKIIFGKDYDLMFEFCVYVDAEFHVINFEFIFTNIDISKIDINKITYRITLSALKFILNFFAKTLNEFKNLNLGIKKEEIKDLVDILNTNATITTLDISNNAIGNAGAQALAEALKGNTTLTILNFSDNQIGDVGVIALANVLKENNTLTKLDISRNNVGYDGAKALAEALKGNTTLTTLDISRNLIGDAGLREALAGRSQNT